MHMMKRYALVILSLPRPIRILLILLHALLCTMTLSAILDWIIQTVARVRANPMIYLDYVFDLPPNQQLALVVLFSLVALLDYLYGWMQLVGMIGETIVLTESHIVYLRLGLIYLLVSSIWIVSNLALRVI